MSLSFLHTRAIIENEKWEFLFTKRKEESSFEWWKFVLPWWKIEKWEKFEDTIIREIKEEVNLLITDFKYIWNTSFDFKWFHCIWIYFACKAKNILDLNNNEPQNHDFTWFIDTEKNIDNISTIDIPMLELYKQKIK